MARHARTDWNIPEPVSWEGARLSVLMDIRDELVRLNALLHCENFVGIPATLRTIAKQTAKRPRVRTVGHGRRSEGTR